MINKLKNLIELEKEAYLELMVVARQEAYIYFDKNILNQGEKISEINYEDDLRDGKMEEYYNGLKK